MSSIFSRSAFFPLLFFFMFGCSEDKDTPFVQLHSSHTNIDFSNDVENTPEFNIQNYLYFYNGGGVAVGDINGDGLPDLFFTGNSVPNKLYLNRGGFVFKDITESAGIIHPEDSWSTGVSMADVNGDGLLDIYVSEVNYLIKKGSNKLYINNGDLTFTERSSDYGVDFEGYSTQAVFFDYDLDGDLDLFILNHSFHSDETYGEAEILRQKKDDKGGDRLFRNEGDNFEDVTNESGIYSSALGYGLGVAVTDINQDGYPDIYVGNDFHEDDYFYINNGDGTFTDAAYAMFGHTSHSSMGSDVGDILNNGRMDIVSLDMMPEDHKTFMRSAGPDLVMISEAKKNFGFGEKNNRNTLQIHRGYDSSGVPVFSETAFASGIARTDWSWAALFADLDNDGYNDLFVSNGIPHRPNDLDYVARLRNERQNYSGSDLDAQEYALREIMPSVKIPNYLYRNNGDLTFRNITEEWGLATPSFSAGAVYADLNNNGYLDLVVNNINDTPFIYENRQAAADSSSYLKVSLKGEGMNTSGIGSKLFVFDDESVFYREQMPVRGFQSSVDHLLHIGLGQRSAVDSVTVVWPSGAFETLRDVSLNQTIELSESYAGGSFDYSTLKLTEHQTLFTDVSNMIPEEMFHRENQFDDFNREPLIPYKLSTRGPAVAVGDVNGNGLDDIYIGGSREYSGKLFLQVSPDSFEESNSELFRNDRRKEDTDAIFFDATGNGLPDLLVVSGGNEYSANASELYDRLYINQGEGVFKKSMNSIPELGVNASVAIAADFDGDGHQDLFVGGHTDPWRYGIGPQSRLLKNNGKGVFEDITEEIAPELETIGNITSAAWYYRNGSEKPDLIVAGEWMPIRYFRNTDGKFVPDNEISGLRKTDGLWQSIQIADLTGNGHNDIILGNFGLNSRLKSGDESPLNLYVNDFDDDGQTTPLITYYANGKEYPFEPLDELLNPFPNIRERISSYVDFSEKTVQDLFPKDKLDGSLRKEIYELRSIVLLNDGDGNFIKKPLPFEAQLFPVYAIHTDDINNDGITDILLGGNLHAVKPSMGGKQDAGYGLLLLGNGEGDFETKLFNESGFFAEGETRAILAIQLTNQSKHVIVARNNHSPLIYRLTPE